MNPLNARTLERLRNIINGDGTDDYRSGPKLCDFFNSIGFSDDYWKISRTQGFPSRWVYTDDKLKKINGTPEMDKCIKQTFAVNNYIGRIPYLENLIADFNQYLAFDKWKVIRVNDSVSFKRLDKVIVDSGSTPTDELKEDVFLSRSFVIDVKALKLEPRLNDVIISRLNEVDRCVEGNASLASVFLIGSIMEGLLLAMAMMYPKQYNQASSAPKGKDGKTLNFPNWNLNNFIDVSAEVGLIKQDVKKFSHLVRDYRNYIHPYAQMSSGFIPDKHTASICFQVLKAAICQIAEFRIDKQEERNNG